MTFQVKKSAKLPSQEHSGAYAKLVLQTLQIGQNE
jgi:hypothetical protein